MTGGVQVRLLARRCPRTGPVDVASARSPAPVASRGAARRGRGDPRLALAVINIALVKTWRGEPEDGVLWRAGRRERRRRRGRAGRAGARAGIQRRDVLLLIDGRESRAVAGRRGGRAARGAHDSRGLTYVVQRALSRACRSGRARSRCRVVAHGLYYSLALVGILAIVVGASVRLRRPHDPATLHFFWLTVAFFGVLAFTPSGRYDRLDYFFEWADLVARLVLPPLFLHFALVFPERPNAWVRTATRAAPSAAPLPAGGRARASARAVVLAGCASPGDVAAALERIETRARTSIWRSACSAGWR